MAPATASPGSAAIARRPLLTGLSMLLLSGCGGGPAPVTLRVASKGEELAFVPDRLACKAGAPVTLIFRHTGTISDDPHDWVLLKPGTEKAFLAAADTAPDGTNGILPANRGLVLVHTPLCVRGGSVTLRFAAPPAGDYPFVCSIPGHGETMHGVLTTS